MKIKLLVTPHNQLDKKRKEKSKKNPQLRKKNKILRGKTRQTERRRPGHLFLKRGKEPCDQQKIIQKMNQIDSYSRADRMRNTQFL